MESLEGGGIRPTLTKVLDGLNRDAPNSHPPDSGIDVKGGGHELPDAKTTDRHKKIREESKNENGVHALLTAP